MAGANSSSGYSDEEGGALSDINVTPLVDVVLVLLIVFMITVPAVVGAARIKVDLPQTSYAEKMTEATPLPLSLFLRRGESGATQLYLEERPITFVELEARVIKQGGASNQVVSFSCDKGTPYGEVVRVIDQLGKMGLHKLSLNTQHVESK